MNCCSECTMELTAVSAATKSYWGSLIYYIPMCSFYKICHSTSFIALREARIQQFITDKKWIPAYSEKNLSKITKKYSKTLN